MKLNDIFDLGQYTEARNYAVANGYLIQDIGNRQYKIVAPEPPTQTELAMVVRHERDLRLQQTDYLLMSDYPISEVDLATVKVYRQNLRDLPQQEGFPWNGDLNQVPWPTIPDMTHVTSTTASDLNKE